LSGADSAQKEVMTEQSIIGRIMDNFQQILLELAHFILITICAILSLSVTSNFYQFLLVVPVFLFVYSFIVHVAYAHLMTNKFDQTKSSQSLDEINTSWHITLATALFIHYTK
jgi:hypothetical protein